MIPYKSKALYKEVAEELNIPINLVEDIIEYYYKEIKSNITGLKHLRINVEGLGQFVIKENFVKKTIPKYKKILSNHDTSTFNAYHNKIMLEKKLIALENIEKQLAKLELKKQKITNKKENYKLNNNET
jgi:hypothetical protein